MRTTEKQLVVGGIYKFAAWLTQQEQPITIGSKTNCDIVAERVQQFLDQYNLGKIEPNFEKGLMFPVEVIALDEFTSSLAAN